MKYALICLLYICFSQGCMGQRKNNFLNKHYCGNSGGNDIEVFFKANDDTIFLFYVNAIDNGKYLNALADSTDYAGYFLLSKMKNLQTRLTIKSYRSDDDLYPLVLKFSKNANELSWNIDSSGPVGFLPKKVSLKDCK